MKLQSIFTVLAASEGLDRYGLGKDGGLVAGDAILFNKFPAPTVQGEKLVRNIGRGAFTPVGHVVGAKQTMFEGETEMAGGGVNLAAVLAPAWEPWMLACAMVVATDVALLTLSGLSGTPAEGATVTGGTSGASGALYHFRSTGSGAGLAFVSDVEDGPFQEEAVTISGTPEITGDCDDVLATRRYLPTSQRDQMNSLHFQHFEDGILTECKGARGTFQAVIPNAKYPTLKFSMTGNYTRPVDQAMPAAAGLPLSPPVAHQVGLKLGAFAADAVSLQIVKGNTVSVRPSLNAEWGVKELAITNAEPTGSLDPEVVALADWDPYALWEGASGLALSLLVGSVPGNRFLVRLPRTLLDAPKKGEREGLLTYDLALTLSGDGDDEIDITAC